MRILVVSNYAEPHIGGLEEVVKRQCRSLVAAGHEVTLVCARHDRAVPATEVRGRLRVLRIAAVNTLDKRFGVPFAVVSPRSAVRLWKLAAEHDAVHVHDVLYPLSHAAIVAARALRRPLFLTQHVGRVAHPSKVVEAVQELMYRTFGHLAYRTAERVVVYNPNVHGHVASHACPEDKILEVRNGIDCDYFAPGDEADRATLRRRYGLDPDAVIGLFVGRLVPKKGFDLVARAGAGADVQTLLVGTGHLPEDLQALPGVHFYGPADAAELRDLYRLSDFFVFPAVGEIFTLVMQEAMASGLPIITTDDPAYRASGLDDRLIRLVDVDAEAISQAMKDLAYDVERRRAMGRYSRQIALDRFSWDRNYETERAIYAAAAG